MEDKIARIIQQKGDSKEIEDLLKKGANVNFIDPRSGYSFLHLGVLSNKAEIIETLIRHKININSKDRQGLTALDYAVQRQIVPIIIKLLIDAGANVRDVNAQGLSPLWLALRAAVSLSTIKLLVDAGADVNFTNHQDGNSCLHLAVQSGCVENVEVLLKHNTNINIRNATGIAPIHLAVERPAKPAIVKLLVEAGAAIDFPDRNGTTALYLAARARDRNTLRSMDEYLQVRECIKILLQYGATINPVKANQSGAISNSFSHQELNQFEMLHSLSIELKFEKALEKLEKQNMQQQREIAQLQANIASIQRQQEVFKLTTEERHHKKLKSDKSQEEQAIKIQSLFRGYFARKNHPLIQLAFERQSEIKLKSPEVLSQLVKEGKYQEANRLTSALQEQRWHEAMQIIRGSKEMIMQMKNGLKLKY